mmetsp:Transcript_34023/g.86046  ORF Transcript_34023/g.86046 Transcript_34023/m.86046 type:complete len:299 (+) Transcript_34023:281-1177(+)
MKLPSLNGQSLIMRISINLCPNLNLQKKSMSQTTPRKMRGTWQQHQYQMRLPPHRPRRIHVIRLSTQPQRLWKATGSKLMAPERIAERHSTQKGSSANHIGLTSPWNVSLAAETMCWKHHRKQMAKPRTKFWRKRRCSNLLGRIGQNLGLTKQSCMRRMRFGRREHNSTMTVRCGVAPPAHHLCLKFQQIRCPRRLAHRHLGECHRLKHHRQHRMQVQPRFTGNRGPSVHLQQCHRQPDHRKHCPKTAVLHQVQTTVTLTCPLWVESVDQLLRNKAMFRLRHPPVKEGLAQIKTSDHH